jgi:phosphate uptake regulator
MGCRSAGSTGPVKAVNIAETGLRLIERNSGWSLPIELSEAGSIAQGMLRDVLDSFVQQDAEKARR